MFLGPRGNPLGATLCQLGLPVLGNEFPRADDFVILVEVHLASMQTGGNCDMKIDGRCHCGFITYEADIDPEKVMVCHCTDCQTLSGSAFRIVAFTRENAFSLLSGEPKIYVKVAESGSKRSQAFCPECGTPIFSGPVGEEAKVHSIRVGTIRQRDQLLPKTQLWLRSSQRWLADLGSVRAMETQPVFNRSGEVS